MKTSFLAFCALLVLSSCKKDYTCECETTISIPFSDPVKTNSTEQLKNMRKKEAIEKCDSRETTAQISFATAKTECEIK